ncbi:hypothetical protein [Nonomuraea roseola]|uniref:Uncharacterized protein n=1 Tax=Nonomuraea roseola TaxID=46179 RepID=A0ABV5Q5F2_9ACTN
MSRALPRTGAGTGATARVPAATPGAAAAADAVRTHAWESLR